MDFQLDNNKIQKKEKKKRTCLSIARAKSIV